MVNENINLQRKFSNLAFSLKHAHKLEPWAFPVMLLLALVEVATPFLNFIFPAAILNELNGAMSWQMLQQLVLLAIGINLGLCLLRHALSRAKEYYSRSLFEATDKLVTAKSITMDYEHVENPKIHELYQLVDEYRQLHGGINSATTRLCLIIQDAVSLTVSLAFMGRLFSLPAKGNLSGMLAFIDSSAASWILLLLLSLGTVLSIRLNIRNDRVIEETVTEYVPDNRRYAYFARELANDYRFGKDVRLYNIAPLLETEMSVHAERSRRRNLQMTNRLLLGESVSIGSSAIISGLVYLFVALKALCGAISIGEIVIYVGAITQLNSGLSGLTNRIADLLLFSRHLEPLRAYLELPPVKDHGTIPVEKRDDDRYEIEFRNVSFRYPGAAEDMLKNVSMKLRIGERLAVVGMNGAGKTTFIKLLCRLYDPTEGVILLNGIDVRKYDYQEYFDLFSVVFQDFNIFAFPVGQNVATSLDYDTELTLDCLDQAGIGDRIRRMPKGLETPLYKTFEHDGVEVSGGEAQKIAIARALYKDAPFIILDEPTAALDPISEFEIYSRFDSLVGSKTAVYISHRLSSCRFCHDILVFQEGCIVQRGSHNELLQDPNGKYYELWNAQAQYYETASNS